MGNRFGRGTTFTSALRVWAPVLLWATSAAAQPQWLAPPEPAVRPQLPSRAGLDHDNNRIDDKLDRKFGALRRALDRETLPERRDELTAGLAAPAAIEVVFDEQVTQKQIDDFVRLGGRIDYLYKAVSYGWNGTLPGASIDALPAVMGPSLLVVTGNRTAKLHMDEATRTGRVRGIWANGFAGHSNGLSGTSDITIAIVDSGVDESHTELAGRQEYWKDYTNEEANPRDVKGHGSHVAGIALGTGSVFGSGSGTLRYTDSGNLAGKANNFTYWSMLHVPAAAMTFTQSSIWIGGGSTTMRLGARTNGVSGGFISINNTALGGSPRDLVSNSFGNTSQVYTSFLPQNSAGSLQTYATTMSVATYPAVGDGFNSFRGVAPGARWAGAKVVLNGATTVDSAPIGAALDDLVVQRSAHNIKIINLSLGLTGSPGLDATLRAKANSAVNNGIVVVASAGNDGATGVVDDPGRASLVLTVGSTDDANLLTNYTSIGFANPGSDEDTKPDLLAPGGSDYYSAIMSVDSNDGEGELWTQQWQDRVANDYFNFRGTSRAAGFVSGSAALLIDAMQKGGTNWGFSSSAQPLFVKGLLNASATETNANREINAGNNPTLGRAAAPKDIYEGYGLMNPDAAIEALSTTYSGGTLSASTPGTSYDRRAWGRKFGITSGPAVTLTLSVPPLVDYDLYLYSATPDAKGNPVIRASSTNAGAGVDESITVTPTTSETRYLFVKRVAVTTCQVGDDSTCGAGQVCNPTVGLQNAGVCSSDAWVLESSTSSGGSCGDGQTQGNEQCDDGNTAGGDCCSANCTLELNGSPCNDGQFCTLLDTCSGGVCSGTGNPCLAGLECNDTCNETTNSCAATAGTPCSSDSNPCTVDQCNGAGACSHTAGNAGAICRASTGVCDVQETCSGTSSSCPSNSFVSPATTCRTANGVCDAAESCTGSSGACPADGFVASTTVCRIPGGVCDAAETCTGTSGACPGNSFAPSSTVCRGSSSVCDAQEVCTGTGAACPSDSFAGSATVCRTAGGVCDAAETCTGSSGACPANTFAGTATVCRAASSVCDVLERCTGSASTCPTDTFASNTVACRGAASVCDVTETCTGTSGTCPGDGYAATNTVCRTSGGICDPQETCTGTSGTCPGNSFTSSSTVCRASGGVCDAQEFCTGSTATCPGNTFSPSTTVCRPLNGSCDAVETCTGGSSACPADEFLNTRTTCRAAASVCDVEESCTGSAAACPTDTFAGNTVACRSVNGVCDVAETCTGSSGVCPADGYAATMTVCRGASGVCDVQETCTGTSGTCPGNGFAASTTVCRGPASVCDAQETCTGGSATCPADVFAGSGAVCRASAGVCDPQETCTGSSGTCPANFVSGTATVCRASIGVCDATETCTGSSGACPADVAASGGTTCRASAGICDVAETCNGTSSSCPGDSLAATTTVCRSSSGVCDLQERCTGAGASCPVDGFATSGVVCRSASGICDVQETCSGASASCPGDSVAGAAVVCRSSAGECDETETCDGASKTCPSNGFVEADTACTADALPCTEDVCSGTSASCTHPAGNAGSVCRTSAGVCDLQETCTGSTTSCPGNTFVASTTVCRVSGGVCDPAESCSGAAATCPSDAVASSTTICRTSAGECDVAERCDGAAKSCPANEVAGADTACSSDGLPCTEDVCDGSSATCTHGAGNAGSVCRASSGVCDAQETCTGISTSCPANNFAATTTVCRTASGVCDAQETCNGSSAACPVDGVAATTVSCRASAGECDLPESCSGSGKTCPSDVFVAGNTGCSNDGNVCTNDVCNGSSPACQHPANSAACNDGIFCNGPDTCSASSCSIHAGNPCPGPDGDGNCAESCNETADACSAADSNGSPCNDGVFCNGADTCSGGTCSVHAGNPCPGPDNDGNCAESCNEAGDSCTAADPNASACNDGLFCTATDTCSSGTCTGSGDPCPGADADGNCSESCNEAGNSCTAADPNASPCNDGLFCTAADACSGGTCAGTGSPCPGADGDGNCAESCNEAGDSCTAADPNGTACTDGTFCNGADTCSGGACSAHAGNPCPGADGDANCSETCNEGADNCTAPDANSSPCNDGLACTTGDACQSGACTAGQNNCGACGDGSLDSGEQCDDGNTANGDCCSSTCTPVTNGAPCNDGQFCNGTDSCQAGACTQHSGNPCPGPDGDGNCSESCNETTDACTAADTDASPCGDDQFCNGTDTCLAGACSQHTGNPCSGPDGDGDCAESCKESNDTCTSADPDASACDDGLFCNGADTCKAGSCSQHTGSPCTGPDGDADCAESCSEANDNCSAADPAASACNDGVFCNGADTCSSGVCTSHAGDPCGGPDGDGNCSESCNEGADDCTAADTNGSPCNDNAFCNGADTCSNGTCSQHAGSSCQGADGDGNCSESCNEAADSCSAADPGGSFCDDGRDCTTDDSCSGGICSGTETPECGGTTTTTIPEVLCGDANDDSRITAGDALAALRTAVGSADCSMQACDYTGDGKITASDALAILRKAVGQNVAPKCPGTVESIVFVTSTLPVTTTTMRDPH